MIQSERNFWRSCRRLLIQTSRFGEIFRRLIYVDLGNCKCAEPGGGGYIEDSPSPTNSSGPATQQVSRANIYSAAREPGGRPARPEGPLSQSNIHSVAREPGEDLQDLKGP